MNKISKYIGVALITVCSVSCNDFLDRSPLDEITPEVYFSTAEQLGTYALTQYDFSTQKGWDGYGLGRFRFDNNTDVQLSSEGDLKRWSPGYRKVDGGDGEWKFDKIYKMNYFFEQVMPKYEAGEISGTPADIDHYIGEMYMLRAHEYFYKLKDFGDFPIITEILDISDKETMIAANERRPMNEVARFILTDLDKAIEYMERPASDDNLRNRLTKEAALLFKSRVALYVGSWLKNFTGTALVPGGDGWPGASKSYNTGFTINIEEEINFFLSEAMSSAEQIADGISLVENRQTDYSKEDNPYVLIYTDKDLSVYPEIIFWQAADELANNLGYGFGHVQGGSNTGYTKGYINSFLMKDGLPSYASPLYKGDDLITDVKTDRDSRLVLFLKGKDEALTIQTSGEIGYTPAPSIFNADNYKSASGYDVKKGLTMDPDDKVQQNQASSIHEYRAAEAYLNYIEASYLKDKVINGKAKQYWRAIRARAGVDTGFEKTIAVTDMSKEADLLSAYTAGRLIDPTLYNIRRERACEFMSEGMRWDDLRRWRSMDQLVTKKFHVEGFKIWGPMQDWYNNLTYLGDAAGTVSPNMSSLVLSDYYRPYQVIQNNNLLYDGYGWTPANYLLPIGMSQFNITSITDGGIDYTQSPLYQNPGWAMEAGSAASNTVGGF